jgi:hypothetical protein
LQIPGYTDLPGNEPTHVTVEAAALHISLAFDHAFGIDVNSFHCDVLSLLQDKWLTFQVLMVAGMKMMVSWEVVLCSMVETAQCFRGAYCYCLHHEGISEMLVTFSHTTSHIISEDIRL